MGILTAFVYEPISLLKAMVKNKFVRCIIDVVFAVVPFLIYLDLSLRFAFPNFRAYMFIGVVFGFILENKSFHKTLAKVFFLVYNKTVSFIRRKNRDGRKETKVNIGRYGVIGSNAIRFNRSSCLSTYRHRCKNQAKKRTRSRKN
ncbi:MAG: spore cortex biosynthesis protein YabQ [Clostridia bacterium]|nr:spore cortex biosynthesis protein YabQ [Clostridia bacterium]